MFGAISRLFWNWSKRVRPWKASRRIRMLHHSPTCSRLRAMGHCMLPKLLRCMGGHGPVNFIMKVTYASNFHYASFYKGVASRFFSIPGAWAGGGRVERRGNRVPPLYDPQDQYYGRC